MEEAASIARTPATCLEAWSGDHRQTPGGLKQNTGSKAFRRKLINRPLVLRGQTKYVQAHELGGIAQRYLDCLEGPLPWKLRHLLDDDTNPHLRLCRYGKKSVGSSPPRLDGSIARAAFAIFRWACVTVSFTCFTKSWVGQVVCALQPTGMR